MTGHFSPALAAFGVLLMSPPATAQDLSKLPVPLPTPEAQPTYPQEATPANVHAEVVLQLDLDAAGRVETATIVAVEAWSLDQDGVQTDQSSVYASAFAGRAQRAAYRLRFEPAEADGVPVPVRIRYTFTFEPPPVAPAAPSPEAPMAAEPSQVSLRGYLHEAGTRRIVGGGLVIITRDEEAFEAITDEQGRFEFFDLRPGPWQLLVDVPGYRPFRRSETVEAGTVLDVRYYLRPTPKNPYDVTVEAGPRREATRRSISGAAAAQVAGTLGDPILSVENLPGVAQAGTGASHAIRGSAPNDTRYYVEGLGTLFDTHVGGFRGVLPAQMVERVDFYPGNFSVRYGRGTGGAIDLKLKSLAPDGLHGALDVSLLDAGLYLEAPLGNEVAIAVGGRRSYIDAVLEAAIPADADTQLSTAPQWYDYQMVIEWHPTPQHNVRVFGFGGNDALALRVNDAADLSIRSTSDVARTEFDYQRVSVQHRFRPSETFDNDLQFGFGRDWGRNGAFGRSDLTYEFLTASLRNEARLKIDRALSLVAGFDGFFQVTNFDVASIRPTKEGDPPSGNVLDGEVIEIDGSLNSSAAALYLEGEWSPLPGWTFVPGLRVDYFNLSEQVTVDPRLVVRYQPHDAWTITAGAGLVHQEAELDELVAPFGNPNIGPIRALHSTLGLRWTPLEYLSADVSLFYKYLDQLVSRVPTEEVYANEGDGQVYGLELLLRHELANHFSGWVSYTLSRAERTDPGATRSRLFDFDQTHIVTLVARYELPHNWSVGGRWRFISGRPFTPINGGVFLDATDSYDPIPGATNSERLGSFHALDLRVDRAFIFDEWRLTAYLSLSNAYNRENPEGVAYAYNYRSRETVGGLPLLPIIGLTGEF